MSISSSTARFEPMPRPWTTMSASVVLHAAMAAAVVALAGVTASVVTPAREKKDLTFVRVVPPPPVRVVMRLPPPVLNELEVVETPPVPIELPRVPEPVVAREEPTPPPAPEPPRPEKPEPPRPVPQVALGSFAASGNSARAAEVARPVQQGGFDAPGARAPEIHTAMAAVGAFEQSAGSARPRPGTDRPNVLGDAGFGAGVTTGRGRGGAGGVVTSGGFGSGAGGTGTGTRPQQAVKTTDFDTREAQQAAPQAVRAARTEVPIEILSKPTPAYTEEARARRIEGDVLLDVEFAATGEIRVLGVVRGLGHGLDESAVRAVQAMRFKPAQRNGQPVDVRTTVNIVFRLA